MRGRPPKETNDALDAGLSLAEDKLPHDIKEFLAEKPEAELWDLIEKGDRLEDAVKIRNGFVYLALKQKLGHDFFKKSLEERKRKYHKAWECMCYARAVQRFPGFAGQLTGRALRHVLQLPGETALQIESSITGIPAEHAKKITHAAIEVEYVKIQQEKQSGKPRKQYPEIPLPEVTKLDHLYNAARSAMEMLAYHKIPSAEYEKAKRYAREMTRHWDHMIYNLADPAHERVPLWEDSRATAADVEDDFSSTPEEIAEFHAHMDKMGIQRREVVDEEEGNGKNRTRRPR